MIRAINIFTWIVCLLAVGFSCKGDSIKERLATTASTEQDNMENYAGENITINEFVDWCSDEDHKLKKVSEIAEIRYHLSYLPAEAMAFLELRTQEFDISKFKETRENYSEMTYFSFKIEVINGRIELLKHQLRSPSQYEARVKYMSFEMDDDIYLLQGKDTLHPGLFHFERIFEVAPYAIVSFAFDNKEFDKNNEFTVVYNDRLFEKGIVKFNYRNKQLINVPNIIGL